MRKSSGLVGLCIVLLCAEAAVACGSSASPQTPVDGGTPDTSTPEPEPEPEPEPKIDSGVDAGKDSGKDAKAEASTEGGTDSGADAGEPVPTITVGQTDRILLKGTLVTPETTQQGEVLVSGASILCVGAQGTCAALPEAMMATVIDTKGIILPGLIDTHNHILFDIFDEDDWKPLKLYQNHDEWPNELRYQAMLDVKQCLANDSQGKPAWCAQTNYGTPAGSLRCEMDKWGELKGLIAGTTSIVGLPGTSAGCFSSLARSVDVSQNGLGTDKVQTSALFPPSNPSGVCQNYLDQKTDAFLAHVGEGIDGPSLAEWTQLGTSTTPAGCLYAPQTTITHGTAFKQNEFAAMAAASMKLTWSPRSNAFLYGQTTDIPTALTNNITVALAPDWSLGGSQNMLDELRFADSWDNANWNNRLSPKDLVVMSTVNAAKVLGLDARIGRLQSGYLADITVIRGDTQKPYDAILAARPKDVRLVMVGGTVLYGDKILEPAAPALPGCETLDICQTQKFLCVATTTTTNKLDQTFAQIKGSLEQALTDVDALTPGDGWNFAPLTPVVKCN